MECEEKPGAAEVEVERMPPLPSSTTSNASEISQVQLYGSEPHQPDSQTINNDDNRRENSEYLGLGRYETLWKKGWMFYSAMPCNQKETYFATLSETMKTAIHETQSEIERKLGGERNLSRALHEKLDMWLKRKSPKDMKPKKYGKLEDNVDAKIEVVLKGHLLTDSVSFRNSTMSSLLDGSLYEELKFTFGFPRPLERGKSFIWYHIPANNMSWVEVSKISINCYILGSSNHRSTYP